jgi:tRNA threonylcarbamoyladenosine biosynthesis protein TsaB
MRILGIESSSPVGSVALVEGGRIVARQSHREPNAHAERLLTMVESLLDLRGWRRADLERVAVGIGPGSFTGLRVGVALAQGLAEGLGIPLLGVPSLQAMANAARAEAPDGCCIAPIVDARRGELFTALYDLDGTELVAPFSVARNETPEALSARVNDPRLLVCGEAAQGLFAESQYLRGERSAFPDAADVALLARHRQPSADVTPHYVRAPDAIVPKLPPNPLTTS